MEDHIIRKQLLFASACGLLAVVLVLIATSKYGLGLSTDGVYYLATADNIAQGRGVVDFKGNLLVTWPPLLPVLLGAIVALTGLPTLLAGTLINLLALFGLVLVTAALLHRCPLQHQAWFYLGTLACALFVSFINLASNFGTDSLFLLLSMGCLLALDQYAERAKPRDLWLAALLVAAAALLRWTGVVLILIGVVYLVIRYWRQWRILIARAGLFGCLAALPFLLWTIGRNYRLTHTFLGPRQLNTILPLENLAFSYQQISQWLLPNFITKRAGLVVLLLLAIGLVLLVAQKGDWQRGCRKLFKPLPLLLALFSLLYFVFITMTTFTGDHSAPYDDRYQAPLYIPLVILFFITFEALVVNPLGRRFEWSRSWLFAILALWLLYPGFQTGRFVQASLPDGVAHYNIYNHREYRESGFIAYLQEFPFEGDARLYSNNAAAVYFYTRHLVENSLNDPVNFVASEDYLAAEVAVWPPEDEAYLVWFTPNWKLNYFGPEQLQLVSQLELVFSEPDGELYRVWPR